MTASTSGPTDAVLAWGLPRLRDLPWRRTRDPWAVLVSEVMLQQTGVARVMPKWAAFLDDFPTPAECAAAPLGDVLRAWQGLGYPRRARHLWLAAAHIEKHHGGRVPDDLSNLLALPGIGPYTARAVLAFAYERDVAVVDTNIARVLARVGGVSLSARQVQSRADELVPAGEGWAWNQALMDLGAVQCRPNAPHCGSCPLEPWCAWSTERAVSPDPAVGSAAVSKPQSRFAGSDREARGRLLRRLSDGALRSENAAAVMDRPDETVTRLVGALVDEGLVERSGGWLSLP